MYETKTKLRSALLLGAATFAAIGLSTAAIAADSDVETVVVTGSRIPTVNLESNSPVAVVTADTIQDTGTITVENLLNTMPQFVPSLTSTSNNPSSGGATGGAVGQAQVDLRGIGSNRVLVLVDGRRLVPSSGSGANDINMIPAALIERVEVMTGGSSAVYGSDAISGVVNFILKKDFEGLAVNGQYGTSQRGDGQTYTLNATLGATTADKKGNVVINLSYDSRSQVLQSARDWSKNALSVWLDEDGNIQTEASGSGTTPYTTYIASSSNLPTQAGVNALFAQYGYSDGTASTTSSLGFNTDGTNYKTSDGTNLTSTTYANMAGQYYNYAATNDLILPFERYSVYASGYYDLYGDKLTAFAEALFTSTHASSQLAPTPVSSSYGVTVPVTNPYIPAAFKTYILDTRTDATADFTISKRFVEAGPRIEDDQQYALQILTGLKGNFSGPTGTPWTWELWYSYGQNSVTAKQMGNLLYSKIEELLYASDGGESTCGSFDIFSGNIDSECVDYISATTHNTTTLTRENAQFNVAGNVYDLPYGPIGLAFGFEWRRDSIDYSPDAILASGDVIGFNSNDALTGANTVFEGYTEVKVPILADLPYAKYLGIEGGFRYSTYALGGVATTYKYGLDYAPADFIRFRAMYQKAVRAPSLYELYTPQYENHPTYSDPCAAGSSYRTGSNSAAVNALCATQFGVSDSVWAANFSSWTADTQAASLVGGNPGLSPETARTITVGYVFTPGDLLGSGFENLTMTMDYYRISMADAISSLSVSTIIGRCFNSGGANPTYDENNYYCKLFSRDSQGNVIDAQQTYINLYGEKVSGIDFDIDYGIASDDIGLDNMGTLHWKVSGTYLMHWQEQSMPGEAFEEYRGTIGDSLGTAFPNWKVNLTTTWADIPTPVGEFTFTHRARFIDDMTSWYEGVYDSYGYYAKGTPKVIYNDIYVSLVPTEGLKIYAGINNLLDMEPPLYTGASLDAGVQANTDPSTYDVMGRYFFFGITYKH